MSEYPRTFRAVLWALFALAVALVVPSLAWRAFDGDEFEHLHGGWCVYHGQVPYRDYFEHHMPLLYFLLAGLYPIFGEEIRTLFAARAMMLGICLVALVATYALARVVYDRPTAWLSVLLLSYTPVFFAKGFEVRPDAAALALALIAQVCLVKGMTRGAGMWYGASGVAIGLSLFFTQKYVFAFAGLTVAALVPLVLNRTLPSALMRGRRVGAFLLMCALPAVAVLCWFWARGALHDFWKQNVEFNVHHTSVINPPYRYLRASLSEAPFVWAAGVAGMALSVWRLGRADGFTGGRVTMLLCTLAAMMGMRFAPVYPQYLLQFVPMLAIYAAVVLKRILTPLFERRESGAVRGARPLCYGLVAAGVCGLLTSALLNAWIPWFVLDNRNLILVVGGMASIILGRSCLRGIGTAAAGLVLTAVLFHQVVLASMHIGTIRLNPGHVYSNAQQIADIRHVMSITSPSDVVLDGWSGAAVFRPHAYYYFFLHPEMQANLSTETLSGRLIAAMRESRCKIVIWDEQIAALPSPVQEFIQAYYRPTGYRSRTLGRIYIAKSDSLG